MKRIVLTLAVVGITWFWFGSTAEAGGHGRGHGGGCFSCEIPVCDPCDPCGNVSNGYSYRDRGFRGYRGYRTRYRSYRAAGWPYARAYRSSSYVIYEGGSEGSSEGGGCPSS